MKQIILNSLLLLALTFFFMNNAIAQNSKTSNDQPLLKTYLIERDIPGAGQLTAPDLKGISQKSCSVLKEMGPGISWIQSFVTGNKIFCVYRAENETLLREHAKKGGFPITSITEINNTISPKTAE
ncbi:MAG TPA: DUF4242 domain-containing protein [Ferruginibacter sp.]|nr:DUF4242 domain-containing protein [Ferruginibacter sp.]